MSVFKKVAKVKLWWALITGAMTFIVIPVVRMMLNKRSNEPKATKSSGSSTHTSTSDEVIDVDAKEVT